MEYGLRALRGVTVLVPGLLSSVIGKFQYFIQYRRNGIRVVNNSRSMIRQTKLGNVKPSVDVCHDNKTLFTTQIQYQLFIGPFKLAHTILELVVTIGNKITHWT